MKPVLVIQGFGISSFCTLRKLASVRFRSALTLMNTTTDPAGRIAALEEHRFEPFDVALLGDDGATPPEERQRAARRARSLWPRKSARRGRSADSSRAVLPSRVTATMASASPVAASVTAASQSARP